MESVSPQIRIIIVVLFVIGSILLMLMLGQNFRVKVPRMGKSKQVVFDIPHDRLKTLKLQNGLKIVALQDSSVPKVLVRVCYDVGSSVEQSYERGLAHLVEHMIFKGTQKLSETDINVIARKYGAGVSYNASTSQDYTTYYFETDKENWKHFIPIMADCMKNALFDSEHLASELKAVVQEFNRGQDNHLRQMWLKAWELSFPPNHPYHFPTIGFKEELANLTAKELKDFYQRYYHPNKAVLFIIGDIDLDEALALAKEQFEAIPSSSQDVTVEFPPLLNNLESVSYSFYQDVKNEELCFFWRLPGANAGQDHLYDLLAQILCHGPDSLLYKRLVDKEMVADRVRASFYQNKEAGLACILVTPKEGLAEKCELLLKDELKKVIVKGLAEEELTKQVPSMVRSFIELLQNYESLSYAWMTYYFAQGKLLEFFSFIDHLYSTKVEDLNKALRDNFSTDFVNKIHLLPLPPEKRSVWEANNKLVRSQEEKILSNHVRNTVIEEPRAVNDMPEAKLFEFPIPSPSIVEEVNGLKTVLYKDSRFPIVNISIQFKDQNYYAYSIDNLGLGLMMQMLLEGSVGFSKQDHLDFFASMGASFSFSSGGIECTVLDSNLVPVLERLFYIIKNPTFRREAFEKCRDMAINQVQRSQYNPSDIARVYFWRNAFKNTEFDYGFETMNSFLMKLTIKDIVNFHMLLNPYALVLGVAGKMNSEQVLVYIDKFTKNWNQTVPYEPKVLPKPALNSIENSDLQLLRDQVFLFYAAPAEINIDTAELPMIILANFIIFYGLGSRLYKVREQTGLFYSITGSFAGLANKVFSLNHVSTLLGHANLNEAESLIKGVLESALQGDFSTEEINAAKQTYANILVDKFCYNEPLINTFVSLAARDLPFDFYKKAWLAIKKADSDSIKYALQKWISLDDFKRIRVGNFRV